jgi:TRAP-type C4-dicarboxylate transport system permease small subunit
MKNLGRFLSKLQTSAEECLGYISALAIASMMVITVADVLVRRVFHGHVIYFGLAYAQRRDAHITIGIVYDRLPRKAQLPIEGVLLSISFILFSALTWYTAKSAWFNYQMGDTMLGAIQVKTWPSRLGVPVGCGIFALRFLAQLIGLVKRGELYEEAVIGEDAGEKI